MNIQAEFSLYPLRTASLGEPVRSFLAKLESTGLKVQQGTMSSSVSGDADQVFSGLSHSFQDIAAQYQSVLLIKISNACPSGNAQQNNTKQI